LETAHAGGAVVDVVLVVLVVVVVLVAGDVVGVVDAGPVLDTDGSGGVTTGATGTAAGTAAGCAAGADGGAVVEVARAAGTGDSDSGVALPSCCTTLCGAP
jgi:hypothetical protein